MLTPTARVLIVDDEPTVVALAAEKLEEQGYVVATARNGKEAWEIIQNAPVDLIVTDVIMPDINGRELSERLLLRQPKMKVLFTSGYTADIIGRHGILDCLQQRGELQQRGYNRPDADGRQ